MEKSYEEELFTQIACTCRPKSRCQSDLSTVTVLANRSLHQDLMHGGCRGTAAPKACPQAFSLFPLPSSPLDQRPVHRLTITRPYSVMLSPSLHTKMVDTQHSSHLRKGKFAPGLSLQIFSFQWNSRYSR